MTPASLLGRLADLVALSKPRITLMASAVAGGAMALATTPPSPGAIAGTLAGVALVVAAANALNMALERDVDAAMERTRDRPLPAGRLSTSTAVALGLGLLAASLPVLLVAAGPLAAALGALAWANYVLVYTPLKRRTAWAVVVGAPSGAMPVLIGHVAGEGRIGAPGLALFLVMLVWQVPHFLAISLVRQGDYARAGIRIMPLACGEPVTRAYTLATATALAAASLTLPSAGLGGPAYAVAALVANVAFVGLCAAGLRAEAGRAWARSVFHASLAYVPALGLALLVDAILR
jgi:protoheme IX farnesyltransferase